MYKLHKIIQQSENPFCGSMRNQEDNKKEKYCPTFLEMQF